MLPGRHCSHSCLNEVSGCCRSLLRRLFPLSWVMSTVDNIDESIAGPSHPSCLVVIQSLAWLWRPYWLCAHVFLQMIQRIIGGNINAMTFNGMQIRLALDTLHQLQPIVVITVVVSSCTNYRLLYRVLVIPRDGPYSLIQNLFLVYWLNTYCGNLVFRSLNSTIAVKSPIELWGQTRCSLWWILLINHFGLRSYHQLDSTNACSVPSLLRRHCWRVLLVQAQWSTRSSWVFMCEPWSL